MRPHGTPCHLLSTTVAVSSSLAESRVFFQLKQRSAARFFKKLYVARAASLDATADRNRSAPARPHITQPPLSSSLQETETP
jgi:hypothetical protein